VKLELEDVVPISRVVLDRMREWCGAERLKRMQKVIEKVCGVFMRIGNLQKGLKPIKTFTIGLLAL
jgi:hypothetical protein